MNQHVMRMWALSGLLGLSACSGINVLNAITPGGYSEARNLAYDPNPELQLDVYVPDRPEKNAPVVVFLYGGSWQSQTTYKKENYRFLGQALAARGFIAIVPDYRVFPEVRYPAFLEDCAKAVVWAHAHAAAFGGDVNRLVLLGHSAGAYNAAMLSLDPAFMKQAGGDRDWIKAMVGLAGPYDFLPLTDPDLMHIFETSASLESTQPINYVDGHNPPMLLMAGENDQVVYAKNTKNLYARIRSRGGSAEKVIYPDMSHIKIIATTASRLQFDSDVMARLAGFIHQQTDIH